MNKFGLIKSLTDDFLPHIASRTEQMEARPILSVERLRFYTGSAIEIFSRSDCQLRLWGYSSAFNPLAYVETIMPPNLGDQVKSGHT